ncbi:MAG: carboxypeptidase regulatory-like domain-containing protein [Haliscomenobacter sp.]|nr:carboxypeptidase regulatory-like domain-containing protein [Haliscomenobacter sp.]
MKTPKEGNDLLRQWLEGWANRFGENRLDEAASRDPFLAEALEGYRSLASKDHEETLHVLNKRLGRRSRPSISWSTGWRVAAALAVLVVVAWAVWRVSDPFGQSDSLAQDTAPLTKTQPAPQEPASSEALEEETKTAPPIASKAKKARPVKPAPAPIPSEGPVKILDLPTAFKEEAQPKASRQEEASEYRTTASRGEPPVPAAVALADPLAGKVTDEQGRPLSNVEVGWENLRIATRSDANGNFLIPQDSDSKTLVFRQNGKTTSFTPQQASPFTVVLGNQASPPEAMARSMAKSVSPESAKTALAVHTPAPEGGFPRF